MNIEFVWNETLANQVKSETERAMRGQAQDIRNTAEQFRREADRQEERANQLEATLPITRQERRTGTNSDGDSYTYYETVTDLSATARVRAEIAEMRRQVEEVRRAAQELERAADELDRDTLALARLFEEWERMMQDIDAACAARMQAIRDEIEAYIRRMEALRDSFGAGLGSSLGTGPQSISTLAAAALAAIDPQRAAELAGVQKACAEGLDPINMATGNFYHSQVDINISGKHPLGFKRFYNAIGGSTSALGDNWTHNFNIRLYDNGEYVSISFEDGHVETFTRVAQGVYISPLEHNNILRASHEESESGFYLVKPNMDRYHFDDAGALRYISDIDQNKTTFEYDSEKALLTAVSNDGGSLSFSYDSAGHITHVTDHTGRQASFEYEDDKLVVVTNPSGEAFTHEYDKQGLLCKIINTMGIAVIHNEYDQNNRAISQSLAGGSMARIQYNDTGLTTTTTDQNGNKITYTRDERYRTTKINYGGCEERYEYDDRDNCVKYTDRNNNEWKYERDFSGNITKETNPYGNTTEYQYANESDLLRIIKPNGATIAYLYNELGILTGQIDELGNRKTINYYDYGQTVTIENERGFIHKNEYDNKGNCIAATNSLGQATYYEYDDLNRLAKITLPDGNARTIEYAHNNKVSRLYDSEGNVTQFIYDYKNNTETIVDHNGNKTIVKRNAMGNPIESIDALGNSKHYEYDPVFNLTKIIDENGSTKTYEYDSQNRLSAVIDEEGEKSNYTYDNKGNLIGITDPLGHQSSRNYNPLNQVISDTNPKGHSRSLEYDNVGNVVKAVDYMGHVQTFEYDLKGQLTKIINPMGGTVAFTYDKCGNRLSETDPMGNTTSYEYDALNRVITSITPIGGKKAITYNITGKVVALTNPEGGKTTFEYDKNGRLTRATNSEGHAISYAYDKNGNVIEATDPRGNKKYFAYDPLNRRTTLTNETGGKTNIVYDKTGKVIETTDPEGAKTYLEYNKTGKVTKAVDALGNATIFEYDPLGRVTKVTDPQGAQISYTYNPLGMVEKVVEPTGSEESYEYDPNSRLTKRINSTGQCHTYEYNALGQVTKATDPLGHSEAFTYDAAGRIAQVTDKNGNTTAYKHDGNGNVVEAIDPYGNSSYFEYDTLNRLVKMRQCRKEGEGHTGEEQATIYQYDGRGLVTKIINNQGGEKLLVYDENGNLAQKTDEDGYVTQYAYNPQNLVSLVNYSDAKQVSFGYNKNGKLVEVNDWLGTTSFELDALSQITAVTDHNSQTVKYAYNPMGKKTEITYPDNSKVQFDYDPIGRLQRINDAGLETCYRYDNSGKASLIQYPNGITEQYEYDPMGRIAKVMQGHGPMHGQEPMQGQSPTLINEHIYDPVGNLLYHFKHGMADTPSQHIEYAYDNLNRLITAKERNGQFDRAYQYDSLGNILAETDGAMVTQYSVDSLNRLTSKVDNVKTHSYQYDGRGNLIQEMVSATASGQQASQPMSYEYDATNRMIKGINQHGEPSEYIYNGLRARVGHISDISRDIVPDYTSYVPKALFEAQGDGITHRYVYGNSSGNGNRVSSTITTSTDGLSTEELATTMHYHNDYLGSVSHVTDHLGKVQAMSHYDEWGNRSNVQKAHIGGKEYDLANSYTGHQWDDRLGGYFAQARFYNPEVKRMAAPDPFWNAFNGVFGGNGGRGTGRSRGVGRGTGGGRSGGKDRGASPSTTAMRSSGNLYAYVMGNPLLFVDVAGLWPEQVHEDITEEAASKLGFKEEAIEIMQEANSSVDQPSFFGFGTDAQGVSGIAGTNPVLWPIGNGGYHFNTIFHGENDSRHVIANRYLDNAVNMVLDFQNFFDYMQNLEISPEALFLVGMPAELTLTLIGLQSDCPDVVDRALDNFRAPYLAVINDALRNMGRGSHPIQDYHAHGNMGNRFFGHHIVDRYDMFLLIPQTEAFGDYKAVMFPWNITMADRPEYEWYCEVQRIRLVFAPHAPNGLGQRYHDAVASTACLFEAFLVRTGLYACTRLREDQRIWSDPGTAQIIGMPVGAAVGAIVAGSASAGATTGATGAIGATAIAGSTTTGTAAIGATAIAGASTTGAPAIAATGMGTFSSATSSNSKEAPPNTSSSFHPDNMAQSQASAESIEQKKTPSPSSDISKDSKEPPPVTPPPRFQQDNRRPPNNSKGTDKESDTTPQSSGSTDTSNFSPTHS